jgi:hypothetical protein
MLSPEAEPGEEYRGAHMAAPSWGIALALLALGCGPRDKPADPELLREGRTYTAWLYDSEYDKLWDRFSPEMRQTFGSVAELANFAGRAISHLGTEQGRVDERVNDAKPYKVYSRSASFANSTQRMLIEWSLAKDGAVTGLVVRPALADSGPH